MLYIEHNNNSVTFKNKQAYIFLAYVSKHVLFVYCGLSINTIL